jgi:CheY-like chemotaxis protein
LWFADAAMAGPSKPLRVLIADDHEAGLRLATAFLARLGCEVVAARNGQEAVVAFEQDPGGFGVVILDLEMPVMDGIDAAKAIREKSGRGVSLVALSAHLLGPEDETSFYFDYSLSKPYRLADFEALLLRFGPKRDTEPVLTALAESFGIPEAEYAELANVFVDTSIEDLADIKAGLASADAGRVAAAAHSLRGAALNFEQHRLAELATRLEQSARRGELDGFNDLVDELGRRLEQLGQAVRPTAQS